tara:strand:- start:145 stop:456 length:312 start_codon:yes stop_codon:yes gene_type:complete
MKKEIASGVELMKNSIYYPTKNSIRIDSDAMCVCEVHGEGWSNTGEGTVTAETRNVARLICLAPNLLEKLKECRDVLDKYNDNFSYEVDNLIKEAEGELRGVV